MIGFKNNLWQNVFSFFPFLFFFFPLFYFFFHFVKKKIKKKNRLESIIQGLAFCLVTGDNSNMCPEAQNVGF